MTPLGPSSCFPTLYERTRHALPVHVKRWQSQATEWHAPLRCRPSLDMFGVAHKGARPDYTQVAQFVMANPTLNVHCGSTVLFTVPAIYHPHSRPPPHTVFLVQLLYAANSVNTGHYHTTLFNGFTVNNTCALLANR